MCFPSVANADSFTQMSPMATHQALTRRRCPAIRRLRTTEALVGKVAWW